MAWLYRYETKGIQNWILNSNLLRDLSGGSALIEALTARASELAKEAGAEDILQATSGSMTAKFPDKESLAKFASEWPMQVAFLTPGLQMIQAWVDSSLGMKALFSKLNEKRNRIDVLDLEVNPWVLRAGRSGLPAIPKPKDIRTNSRLTAVDALAVAKERSLQGEHYKRKGDVTGDRHWDDFVEDADQWPSGPVAIIHADGSGVGQMLMNIGDDHDKLKNFSNALKESSKQATIAAVNTLGPDGTRLYARPVVSAGDDLTYIVPASKARAFAATWLHEFEKATEERAQDIGGKLYGGAGIVVVQKGYPFANAYEHCESLCKAAKDRLKKLKRNESVIAVKRITTSLLDEEELTAGTFAWVLGQEGGLQHLDKLVSAVRELPRGTLRTWLDHFLRPEGKERAQQLWTRAGEVARSKKPESWKSLESALRGIGADPACGAYAINDERKVMALPLGKSKSTTPLGDALTLKQMEAPEDR